MTPIPSATAGYGVANCQLVNGREADAPALFERIVAGEQWPAFGFIARKPSLPVQPAQRR